MTGDRVAVVTGGNQGIGRSVVGALLRRGLIVESLDLRNDGVTYGDARGARTIVCDVADEEAVAQVAQLIREEHGHIDVLVNNAGWVVNESFSTQAVDLYSRLVAVNLLGVLHMCHHFSPMLNNGGAIVNVASDASRVGVPREAVYAGAKGGVVAFSKSLAAELGERQIRVNVVSPGTTLTPLVAAALSEDQIARRLRGIPLRRLGEPEDVAEVICTLALEWSYVTGQVVSVNGGASRLG